jgi:hypothetical protein
MTKKKIFYETKKAALWKAAKKESPEKSGLKKT